MSELLNKIRTAYESESEDLGSLLKEAGFTEQELNSLRTAYEDENDAAFGAIIKSKFDNQPMSKADSLRQESVIEMDKVKEIQQNLEEPKTFNETIDYIMNNNMNDGRSREEVEREVAAFPKLTQSQINDDPWYKQVLKGIGDIVTIPGRTARMSIMDEGIGGLGETQPTSDNIIGQVAEGIAQSPSSVPLLMTGVGSIPMLATVGTAGAVADEAYHADDETGTLDYLVSGAIGGLTPAALVKVGKVIQGRGANFVKKFLMDKGKTLQETEDILTAVTSRINELIKDKPRTAVKGKLKGSEKAAKKLINSLQKRKSILNTKITNLEKALTKTTRKASEGKYTDSNLDIEFRAIKNDLIDLIEKIKETPSKLVNKGTKKLLDWTEARLFDVERMYNNAAAKLEELIPTKPISGGMWSTGYQGFEKSYGELPYDVIGGQLYENIMPNESTRVKLGDLK